MKSTKGENVKVSTDSTGSIISVDWVCPYCEFENHELVNTSTIVDVDAGFEMDRNCTWCDKTATVECLDVEEGLM